MKQGVMGRVGWSGQAAEVVILELGPRSEGEPAMSLLLIMKMFGVDHSRSFTGDLAWPAEGPARRAL